MTDHKTQSDYFISSFRNRRAEKNRSRGTSGMESTSSYTPPFYIQKPPWDHKIVGHRAVAQRGDCTSMSLTSRSEATLIETSSSQNTRPTAESHAMPQYWKVSTKAAWLKTSSPCLTASATVTSGLTLGMGYQASGDQWVKEGACSTTTARHRGGSRAR